MTEYVKSTNFASKDSLSVGNPLKIVKGTEIDAEFNNISTAVATKADLASPTFTGTPLAPTATVGTNSLQVANTAFVQAHVVSTSQITTSEQMTTANVLNATAGASVGAVGTYMFAYNNTFSGTSIEPGATLSGSSLKPASLTNYEEAATAKRFSFSSTALSGTWRCMGYIQLSAGVFTTSTTLWLRIS